MRDIDDIPPRREVTVAVIDGDVYFDDSDGRTPAAELDDDERADWWDAVTIDVSDAGGRTVTAVVVDTVPGPWGDERCTHVVFSDGTSIGFVQPDGT